MDTRVFIHNFIFDELLRGACDTPLNDDEDLIESGVIDSLGIMSLLIFIEEHFSIKISPDDLVPENFSSINTITMLVNRQINN